MPHLWAEDTVFRRVTLDVQDRQCSECDRGMHICDHRTRKIFTLQGPWLLVNRLVCCPDKSCPGRGRTFSPELEPTISMPRWLFGWDAFAWVGHRRFARHWSIPQIRAELADSYQIHVSEDLIETTVRRYQTMLAARQQDVDAMRADYAKVPELLLSIDGLQPEKGHETLYVVRELANKRVWFAEPLLSSTTEEVGRLFERAREWAESLGKPVALWVSDKQEAFVKGVESYFAGVPHRYCQNHFLRDLAKEPLEQDSHAKVQMRRKVRGLRTIEREVLDERRDASKTAGISESTTSDTTNSEIQTDAAGQVVLDYCSAVRGILNDDQGGPLHPPGMRMAEALGEVRESLQRNLDRKKGARRAAAEQTGRRHRPWLDTNRRGAPTSGVLRGRRARRGSNA